MSLVHDSDKPKPNFDPSFPRRRESYRGRSCAYPFCAPTRDAPTRNPEHNRHSRKEGHKSPHRHSREEGHKSPHRHSREGGNPVFTKPFWILAFARMTVNTRMTVRMRNIVL